MKILLICRYINSTTGGAEYVTSLIAKFLAENENKVWIISNKVQGIQFDLHKNMKILYLQNQTTQDVRHWKTKDKLSYIFSASFKGYSIIKKEKIDLIISHTNQPSLVGWILSSLTSLPHIVTIHGTDSLNKKYLEEWAKQKGNSKFKAKLGYFMTKTIFKLNYTAIHAVSEAVKDDLIKIGIKKPIYVIHNAIPIEEHVPIESKPFQFIVISRLEFFKNIQITIKAIKLVKKSYPEVKLIILGDGSYRHNLEKLTKELDLEKNIIFKGYISGEEKKKLLSESLALLLPSLSEGFPMVIIEAFAQKKPVLISNIKAMTDIVEHEKTGLIVIKDNELEWAKAIEYVIQDPKFTTEMGENGRANLEKKYNLELMKKHLIEMYDKITKDQISKG